MPVTPCRQTPPSQQPEAHVSALQTPAPRPCVQRCPKHWVFEAVQSSQASPGAPHTVLDDPGWHTPRLSQQPLAQLHAGDVTHCRLVHAAPPGTPGAVGFAAVQSSQACPEPPHSVSEPPARQTPSRSQQPSQLPGPQGAIEQRGSVHPSPPEPAESARVPESPASASLPPGPREAACRAQPATRTAADHAAMERTRETARLDMSKVMAFVVRCG